MIINDANLSGLFRGFSSAFKAGLEGAPSAYAELAMTVPSATGESVYPWLGQVPSVREWLGDRIVKNLVAHGYTIKNKTFESTIEVARTMIEDDQYGVYGPMMSDMGRAAGENPDNLVFSMLASGFTALCYDGQPFFSPNHPTGVKGLDGVTGVASNMEDGGGAPWYLFDTSRSIKGLIYQERMPPVLTALNREEDANVFSRDQFIYGTRSRANAGFGLWQLVFASKADLNADNYAAARQAMMALRGESGRLLGIKPDTLVIPPSLEVEGRTLLLNQHNAAGATNPWFGSAKMLMTSWLAN